jgi:hypothetical protein
MRSLDAKVLGGSALGVAEGFPYSADLLERGDPARLVFRFLLGESTRRLAAALNRQRVPFTHWYAGRAGEETLLEGVLTPPSEFYLKAGVSGLLTAAAAACRGAGLAPPAVCPLCRLSGCDACALLQGGNRPVHTACLNARLTLPEEDTQTPKTVRGRILTGIPGALLGAFMGALPIWALALSKGTLYWALYAFIPLLSGLCYRLCRGRASINLAAGAVLSASLLAAFALEQVWYWLLLTGRYGVNVPFSVSASLYFKAHTLSTALSEMLLCLVALLLGFVAAAVFLRRYAAGGQIPPRTVRGAKYIRANALPMAPPAGAAAPKKPPPAPPENGRENEPDFKNPDP